MFKMVEVSEEQGKEINKPVFTNGEDIFLVHFKGTSDDVVCFSNEKDFKIIPFSELGKHKEDSSCMVVNLGDAFVNQRKLIKIGKKLPNVRFTGSNLIQTDQLKLGVLSKDSLESKLSCKIKDNKSFIYKELIEIVPFNSEIEIKDFDANEASLEGVRFGVVRKGKRAKTSKFKDTFKKKKRLFEEGMVEF